MTGAEDSGTGARGAAETRPAAGATTLQANAPSRSDPKPRTTMRAGRPAGLWQLFAVKNEDQDHSFVSKQVPQVGHFEDLANNVVADSFDLVAREVNFGGLDEARVQPVGLLGSNEDVWRALQHVGLEQSGARATDMSEGLWLWCPSLAEKQQAQRDNGWDPGWTDVLDIESDAEDESAAHAFYVFVWAGRDVSDGGMHPPFNLSVRLLLELTDNVHVIVNAADAAALDDAKKPFKTGAGFRKTFTVEREAAETTAVEIGANESHQVSLPHSYHSTRRDATAMACIGTRWHAAAHGARSIQAWQVTGTRNAQKTMLFDADHGLGAAAATQFTLSTAWRLQCAQSGFAVTQLMRSSRWLGLTPVTHVAEAEKAVKRSALSLTLAALLDRAQLEPFQDSMASWKRKMKTCLDQKRQLQQQDSATVPDALVDSMRKSRCNWRLAKDLSEVAKTQLKIWIPPQTFLDAFADVPYHQVAAGYEPMDIDGSADGSGGGCGVAVQCATAPPQTSPEAALPGGPNARDGSLLSPRAHDTHVAVGSAAVPVAAAASDAGQSVGPPVKRSYAAAVTEQVDAPLSHGPNGHVSVSVSISTRTDSITPQMCVESFFTELASNRETVTTLLAAAISAENLDMKAVDDEIKRAVAAVHILCGIKGKVDLTTDKELEMALELCETAVETVATSQRQGWWKEIRTGQTAEENFLLKVARESRWLRSVDFLMPAAAARKMREVVAMRLVDSRASAIMRNVWREVIKRFKKREHEAAVSAATDEVRAVVDELRDTMDAALAHLDAHVHEHNEKSSRRHDACQVVIITKVEEADTWSKKQFKATCEYILDMSGLAFMCTQVQSRSSGGESGAVQLGARVVEHALDDWTSPMQVLLISSTESRPPKLVRVESAPDSASSPGTHVYLHPASAKIQHTHRMKHIKYLAAAASFEPSTRVLAVLFPDTARGPVISLFVFDAEHKRLSTCRELVLDAFTGAQALSGHLVLHGEAPWVLLPRARSGASEATSLQDKMVLIVTPEKINLLNCTTSSYEPQKLDIDTSGIQWFATPNCAALLGAHFDRLAGVWQIDAYALEECLPSQPMFAALGQVPLPHDVRHLPESTRFTAVAIQGSMYLLAASPSHPDRIVSAELKVRSVKVANTLQSKGLDTGNRDVMPWSNKLLNYFHSVCERFPLDDCLNIAMLQRMRGASKRAARREIDICLCTGKPEDAERLREYVAEVLEEVLDDSTQKPHGACIHLEPSICTELPERLMSFQSRPTFGDDATRTPLGFGTWLRHAMCLAPLQISRCAGNTLEPMHDGELRPVEAQDSTTDIIALSERLRLGLYECVLNAHDGPVVVACALGQQSVGKSYQLNHLGGVFLDVAGGRCTDGVWLTARHFTDEDGVRKLLLFLDCEGIGSLERTETEDMLHCLLAAAVSSFTMFKTHFAFNRELVETLKRLNKGAQKVQSISGDSEKSVIFQGSIMFCLKDVQRSAMQATVQEFQGKLRDLVQEEQNFVTSMYNNAVAVAAFPGLSRWFYRTLEKECVPEIRSPDCPGYQDGRKALQIIKLMLVKMAHKDWTPIDRQWITSQAAALRAVMHAACHFGCRGNIDAGALTSDDSPLLPAQQDAKREVVTVEVTLPSLQDAVCMQQVLTGKPGVRSVKLAQPPPDDVEQGVDDSMDDVASLGQSSGSSSSAPAQVVLLVELELDDHKLRLGHLVQLPGAEDAPAVSQVSDEAVNDDMRALKRRLAILLELDKPDKDADQFQLLHAALRAVVSALLKRREARCVAWLQAAVIEFKASPEASELQNLLSVHLQRLEAAWTLCGAACAKCHLPCTALGAHTEHSCGTDHRCQAQCEFCLADLQYGLQHEAAGQCKDKAGHSGRHMCETRPHACGKECKFSAALNCRGTCRKQPGHDGDCDCESGNHLCGAPCDLPGCGGRCTQPHGAEHERHACGDTSCPERCPLCDRKCPEDHFHALTDPTTHHLCGREHACIDPVTRQQRPCASAGVCAISAEIETVEKRMFRGRADQFEYDHHTMQVVKQDVCTKMVPSGKMAHEGPCCCARKEEEHFCAHECPGCQYRCTKHKGHTGRHKMQHGNMSKQVFLANQDTFSLGTRKYARGDTGEAETCDSACSRLGRGHVHLMHCNKNSLCGSAMHDGVRHLQDPDVKAGSAQRGSALKLDECTHDFYWKHLDIEDPCVEDEKSAFRMCGSTCASEEHQNADGTCNTVHCVLPLWHAPLDPLANPRDHLPSGQSQGYISSDGCLFPCRHITAADAHTILVIDRSGSMSSGSVKPDSADIRRHAHFAGLDNVLGVVYEAALKYMRERSARAPHDLLTFVPFDDRAEVTFAAQPITHVDHLLNSMMQVKSRGGTAFFQALETAFYQLTQWRRQSGQQHKPVVIMLTDSGDNANRGQTVSTLQRFMRNEASYAEEERATVHMVGFGPSVDAAYMQQLANIGNGSYLVCQTGTDMDRLDLVKAFSRLAAQPALKVSLLQDIRQSTVRK